MKSYILIIMTLFLVACTDGEAPRYPYFSSEVLPYAQKYQEYSETKLKMIRIEYSKDRNPTSEVSSCSNGEGMIPVVTVYTDWNILSVEDKEKRIFFEIGRCYLRKAISNQVEVGGRASTIMNPNLTGADYIAYYEDYLSEFLGKNMVGVSFDDSTYQ